MLGRPIVNKHKAYAFHQPSALWIAQIIVDFVFSAVRILTFSIMVYFMCGLVREAGAFFTFYVVIISGYLAMTLFFRSIGCACPDFDYAIRFGGTLITLFIITSGYLIQYQSEKVWIRWIYWINPLGYGFSTLMENEFSRITLTCTDLVPSGEGYSNIENQVCTLQGSTAGTDQVSGSAYILQAFNLNPSHLWANWGIIIVLIIVFLVTNATLGEWLTYGKSGSTANVFKKQNKERERLNRVLIAARDSRGAAKDKAELEVDIASKAVLTWEGLSYDIPTPSGELRLLDNIYGYIKPGELTALMGASGAGKTTLLDVLAKRKNTGIITGEVLVDGVAPRKSFQRETSYAEQLDIHEPTATVREAFRFSADLRQPITVPQSEKHAYVEEILSLLELEDIADAIIGGKLISHTQFLHVTQLKGEFLENLGR